MSSENHCDFSCRLHSARAGDTNDLTDLINSYRQYLRLLARMQLNSLLRTRVAPSDVVQESVVRAKDAFATFRGETEAEWLAWLRRILATQLALYWRHHTAQRRDIHVELRLADVLDQSSAVLAGAFPVRGPTPDEQAIHHEQAAALAAAIDRLSPSHAEVILSRHLENQPFAEIAARMDRSEAAVRSLWTRAIQRLREELGETG